MPPAPGCIETIAPRRSYSPPSISRSSWRSSSARDASFFGHLQEHARLVQLVAQHLVARQLSANLFLLLERRLCSFLPIPEIGLGRLFDELVLADGQCGDVKDASRASRRGHQTRKAAVSCR